MSNNEQQQKSFANIISKEELEKFSEKEKEQYYIKHNILIPFNDSNNINSFLIDEIFDWFIKNKQSILKPVEDLNLHYKLKFKNILNQKKRKKNIEKVIKTNQNFFIESIISLNYIDFEISTYDINDENLKLFIKNKMLLEKGLIDDYITNYLKMNFENYTIFKSIINIEYHKTINDYLVALKDNLNIKANNDLESVLNTDEEKYYSIVFKSRKAENTFIKILYDANAINKNKKPVKRKFQTNCDAFYNIDKDKYFFLKPNVLKKDFIKFLNKKFKTDIEKLSNGGTQEKSMSILLKPYLVL